MATTPPVPLKRSTFVTVLSWIFIGLSGFMTLISVLQNIMVQLVFLPALHEQLTTPALAPGMPPGVLWMSGHIQWFFRLFLLLALTHLVGAIALLRRNNWGRLLFIGVLVFDIVYQLASVALMWWFMRAMMHAPGLGDAQAADAVQMMAGMMMVMRIFSLILALGFVGLFGWIIVRLRSEPVRREFTQRWTPA